MTTAKIMNMAVALSILFQWLKILCANFITPVSTKVYKTNCPFLYLGSQKLQLKDVRVKHFLKLPILPTREVEAPVTNDHMISGRSL